MFKCLLMCLLFLPLVGCQNVAEDNSQTSPEIEQTEENEIVVEDKTNITIAISSFLPQETAMEQAMQFRMNEFNKVYPEVNIVYNNSGTNVHIAGVASDFLVGQEPDILFFLTDNSVDELFEQGSFVPVEVIRATYPNYGTNIMSQALTSSSYSNGISYAIPVNGHYYGLYCNKNLFDQHNVELPTNWDNLNDAINIFSNLGIVPIGSNLYSEPTMWINHLLLANNTQAETWNNQLAYDIVMNELQFLYNKEAFATNFLEISSEQAIWEFENGGCAMILEGSWLADNLPIDVEILPMPFINATESENTRFIAEYKSGFYITTKGYGDIDKQPYLIEFVQFMTSDISNDFYVNQVGGISPIFSGKEILTIPTLEADPSFIMQSIIDLTIQEEEIEIFEE
ncbi:MAG: hypothetical protein ATN36_05730 [Epulopiscium sp. Nele67-Bin005]|nr:MAG: hypothetical protein ATN36_05730 [Epulopiscium sp. Nele67-Bin005]